MGGRLKVLIVLTVIILFIPSKAAGKDYSNEVELWFFWGDGCDLCEDAACWLDEMQSNYPDMVIKRKEVWFDQEEQKRYIGMMEERGMTASWVPGFILNEKVWEGFNENIAFEIEAKVEEHFNFIVYGKTLTGEGFRGSIISLGPLGSFDIHVHSLITSTLLIALIDGFNPCSLWVITVLLAMILHTKSRGRIAAVGVVFLLVTAMVYGIFITGLFSAFTAATQIGKIRIGVASLALVIAVVNIKDFFFFRKGLSLSVPDRFKPSIYRCGREVSKERPITLTLAITVVFAAGVAIIELPCTAGFPAVWIGLLSEMGVARSSFIALLLLYLLAYLFIEILIVLLALVTMQATRLQEVHGRNLKLISGMVMAAIAIVLLIDPSFMESLTGTLYMIGSALLFSCLIILGYRLWQIKNVVKK